MKKGKIIVIEGTDCSGKQTQSNLLIENLKVRDGIEATYMCYPRYDSPTGKIIGLPYLGKTWIMDEMIDEASKKIVEMHHSWGNTPDKIALISEFLDELKHELGHCWFPDGANSVDPKVASLYYAADRLAHQNEVEYTLNQGTNVILDRYVYSNSAHQGGKKSDPDERNEIYEWNDKLEFGLLGLLPADLLLFLHMPTPYANEIKKYRQEALDEHEKNAEHILNAERAYIEVAKKYGFHTIECIRSLRMHDEANLEDIKTPEEIAEEVYNVVKRKLTL